MENLRELAEKIEQNYDHFTLKLAKEVAKKLEKDPARGIDEVISDIFYSLGMIPEDTDYDFESEVLQHAYEELEDNNSFLGDIETYVNAWLDIVNEKY